MTFFQFLKKQKREAPRRFFILLFAVSFAFWGGIIVLASPPDNPYAPGATLDPDCVPGSANCTVYPPLATGLTATTTVTMSDYPLNFDSGTFYIDSLNNRIGIGTSTPNVALDVIGSSKFSTGIKDNAETPLLSIDAGARKLYASDGATVGLDYSVAGAISGGGAVTPTTGSNFFGSLAGYQATNATDSNFFGSNAGYQATEAYYSNFFGSHAGYGASEAILSNFFGFNAGYQTNATASNFFGSYAGYQATNAIYSNFFGQIAGKLASEAQNSNFFGDESGHLAIYASYSNFFGQFTGYYATNASYSNFFGIQAGYQAINAKESIFLGSYAGYNDTVDNVTANPAGTSIAIGRYSGTGGFSNSIAIGHGVINSAALQANIGNVLYLTGIYNSDTQSSTPMASGNVGIGTSTPNVALDVIGSGKFSTGIYDNAETPLLSIDTGARKLYASNGSTLGLDYSVPYALSGAGAGTPVSHSNFFGPSAGDSATNASDSNFFGTGAGENATNAYNSNFFGRYAGSGATYASHSNFFGDDTGYDATNAYDSNFFGNGAGDSATNARYSNFFGNGAGDSATNARYSNFFGMYAGDGATNARYSNFFGNNAGYGATNANSSNFFGDGAGQNATDAEVSNFYGIEAGRNATNASDSNFFGDSAGYAATNAEYSNFIGSRAGSGATYASYSNFIGPSAGSNAANAKESIFLGTYAGYSDTVDNVTANPAGTSIAIGRYSGTGGFSNSIAIGHGVINSAALQANIGNVLYLTGIYNSDTQSSTPMASGNVGIGTSTPGTLLSLGDTTNYINFSNTATSTFAYGVDVKSGCFAVNGVCISGGGSQTPWISNINAAGYTLFGNSTANGNLTFDSTSDATKGYVLINPTGGNVGIGTTTPGTLLSLGDTTNYINFSNTATSTFAYGVDVKSGCFAVNGVCISGGGSQTPWTSAINGGGYALSNAGIITATNFIATSTTATSTLSTGGLTVGTSQFVVQQTSGNVGIGTSTPNNTIQVKDLINFDNSVQGTFLGYQAGNVNTGGGNSFIGYQSGLNNTTGYENAAVGAQALYSNTIGVYNVAMGKNALYSNTTGSNNTAVGKDTLRSNTTGYYNVAMGTQSLNQNTTGFYNTAVGVDTLIYNTTGYSNTAMGHAALQVNTTGYGNTAVGVYILKENTTGYYNVAMGTEALYRNTSATSTTAIGYGAASGSASYSNQYGVYLGYQAGYSAQTGSDNNTMLGYQAGYGVTTGANNILLGYKAGEALTTGSNNIIIGYDIDAPVDAGSNQLSIGNLIFGTGIDGANKTLSTGNVGIGTTTPASKLDVWGNLRVGTSATPALFVDTATGFVGIGTTTPWRKLSVAGTAGFSGLTNDATGYYLCLNTTTYEMATSTTACGASSLRFKENVQPMTYGLSEILQLNPVFYDWKDTYMPSENKRQIGLIAEEASLIIPELAGYDSDGSPINVDYPKATAVIIKAIQELNEKISSQTSAVSSQLAGSFDGILDWLGDKVVRAKEFVADKITAKELCIEDVCVTRDQLKELLEKNGISAPTPTSVPEPEPEPVPEPIPELEPVTKTESLSEPIVEEPTPEPAPTVEPAVEPVVEEPAVAE